MALTLGEDPYPPPKCESSGGPRTADASPRNFRGPSYTLPRGRVNRWAGTRKRTANPHKNLE
jgi:hypothetical protein